MKHELDEMEEEEDSPKKFNIELTYRTTITAKDKDEAYKLARDEMVKYPIKADVTFIEEA
jgi:hypothetical protein